jgi:hypothetical protein
MSESVPEILANVLDENIRPVEETARGYKLELIRNGWTEASAEHVAKELLIEMTRKVFRAGETA